MINGLNFYSQPVKNDVRTFDNISRIATGQGDDYTTGCLLDYPNFKNFCKMIAIDLSKQKGLVADPKAIKQILLLQILIEMEMPQCYLLLKKQEKPSLTFLREQWVYYNFTFSLIWYQCKMTQYDNLNVQLPNSQLNKLKSRIKQGTEVTLKLSSNVVSGANETNFPHTFLLTDSQDLRLCKAFANDSSANKKLSKTQLFKIGQSGGFLGRLAGPLLKTGLPLIGGVLKPLAKSVLMPLWLTVVASATDVAIHKKIFGSSTSTLILSNEELNDIMKIIKSLEESGFLIKGFSKAIKNEAKEQKGGFLAMLLSTWRWRNS